MQWLRSQLFWKIVGLYSLLSGLAVTSLVTTISVRLQNLADSPATASYRRMLQDYRDRSSREQLSQSGDARPDSIVEAHYQLTITEATREPLISEPSFGVSNAMLRSLLTEAARTAGASRIVETERGLPVLIAALPLDASSEAEHSDARRLAVLIGSLADEQRQQAGVVQSIQQAAGFTWCISVICVGIVALGLVEPLRVMTENLSETATNAARQDMLLQISDRRDELGNVAQSLSALEEDRELRIRELERAGEESRSVAELLSAVLDSMVEGVLAIDDDERLLYLNSAARTLLAIGDRIEPGRRLYEAVRIPAMLDSVAEALKSRSRQSLEFRSLRGRRHLAMVANPFISSVRDGAVIVVRDVSELRRLESMRRDFVSGVSHELKTPLTAIQACTETLLDGALDEPQTARHFLRQIEDQSDRLLRLILGMLQLARVESGTELFEQEPTELLPVVDDVLVSLEPIASTRNIRLTVHGVSSLVVTTDRAAIRTVISNLVDNAIRHSPDGAAVTVELAESPNEALILVRDCGEGIAAEHLPRIFERFYRVHRDRSRSAGGTGLGLAIVKHLCQALKATVTVQSEPGVGTEFRIGFPSSGGAPSHDPGASMAADPPSLIPAQNGIRTP